MKVIDVSLSLILDKRFIGASWVAALLTYILGIVRLSNALPIIAFGLFLFGVSLVAIERVVTDEPSRDFILKLFLLAVAVRILLALALPFMPSLIEFDSRLYDQIGWKIALTWQQKGIGLVLDAGIPTDPGYYYIVAGIYGILGRDSMALSILNAFLGAFLVVPIYFLGVFLSLGRRVAQWSAILVAFWPSLIYWTSQNLKEASILLLLVSTVLAVCRLCISPNWRLSVLTFLAIILLGTLRLVLLPVMLVLMLIAFALWLKDKVSTLHVIVFLATVVLVGFAAFGLMFASRYTPNRGLFALDSLIQIRNQNAYGATALPLIEPSLQGVLSYLPMGLAYFLAAPFPWIAPTTLRQWLAIPEILTWYLMIPMISVGLWLGWRNSRKLAILIALFLGLMIGVTFVMSANLGTLHRIRLQVWIFCFVLAAWGFDWLIGRVSPRRRSRSVT